MTDPRRALPSVSALLESDALRPILGRAPRGVVTDAVRAALDAARRDPAAAPHDEREWAAVVGDALERIERPSLRPLFNATGVVLHTNLGRAPLADAALAAIARTAGGFCNLEYDVEHGSRGSRYTHCVSLLTELTGAEDAIVVNNGAAALVLALNALAEGKEAIVSRGELIEIGGSFRVPDIMAKSGARLIEVGTTNRTHVDDYRRALSERTGAIVKVHRSNFTLDGFVAEASLRDLAPVAAEAGVPLLSDFGSGLLLSLEPWGLRGEPTAADEVRAGATLVLMSGDKLLGGPQAGVIVGSRAAVSALRRNPLARALRVDKLTLAALGATLALYRDPARAVREIPALAMLTAPVSELRGRAETLRARLAERGMDAAVVETEASVGGGAFPTARIPSFAVALGGAVAGDAVALERRARLALPTGVIGRIADDRFLLDLRSIPAAHDDALTTALLGAFA
ncbi:MAG TPA: L-seryl-tRNA(Sec) selenium transferase [Gemmatimonadaceae bacterium]|nr:L-seryl-tRNA(Sec) selenium transferase [Gemmatimonadaceae bacterium]